MELRHGHVAEMFAKTNDLVNALLGDARALVDSAWNEIKGFGSSLVNGVSQGLGALYDNIYIGNANAWAGGGGTFGGSGSSGSFEDGIDARANLWGPGANGPWD